MSGPINLDKSVMWHVRITNPKNFPGVSVKEIHKGVYCVDPNGLDVSERISGPNPREQKGTQLFRCNKMAICVAPAFRSMLDHGMIITAAWIEHESTKGHRDFYHMYAVFEFGDDLQPFTCDEALYLAVCSFFDNRAWDGVYLWDNPGDNPTTIDVLCVADFQDDNSRLELEEGKLCVVS